MQKLNNEVMKMMKSAVEMCASKYNFDGDEAMRMICESEGLSCSSSSRVNKRNVNKKEKREIVKSLFPLPYNGELNGECCFGIRQNSGLYTQCPSNRLEDKAYCGSCEKQATKNEHGLPDYGSIQTRLSKYNKDEEFVDPSGKKPVAYTKIMKKLKLTEEQVREEAAKHNMTLDPRHFVEVEKKSGRPAKEPKEPKELKAKGRPKKSKKVLELAGEEEDLFASLVMSANKIEDVIAETVTSEVSSEADDNSSLGDVDVVVDAKSKPKTDKKPKVSAEEKAALAEQKKLALAEQKKQEAEQKKLEAEQKKIALAEQKKLEAEVKKFALAEQKKAEAEQKKLEAEQKKQALAEQKKQEAEQKKLALAEQKKLALAEQKKPAEKKVATKKTKVDDDDRPSPAFVDPPAEEADVVKKIMFEGKKYLKSKNTGIIYNMEQDVIGKWNEAKNRIDFDVADEESEEEYDEDM
jgi:hypothetical protein